MKRRAPASACRWNKHDWKKRCKNRFARTAVAHWTAGIRAGELIGSGSVQPPVRRHFAPALCDCLKSSAPYDLPNSMAKGNNQKQSDGSNLDFEAQLWAAAEMSRANWNDISRYETALPLKQLAADFTEKPRPLVERIMANIHESRILTALRDALLPKLLSGALRVPVAEKLAEAMA
jgi:hypothetical protein